MRQLLGKQPTEETVVHQLIRADDLDQGDAEGGDCLRRVTHPDRENGRRTVDDTDQLGCIHTGDGGGGRKDRVVLEAVQFQTVGH